MAKPSIFSIKESIVELKKLQKTSIPLISNRIRVLIEFKKYESVGVSKIVVAETTGLNPNSVQKYRQIYKAEGLAGLLKHNKKGFKPSFLTKEEHSQMEDLLNDPKNGLRGYVELLEWVEVKFGKFPKYNTLLKYAIKNFNSKVKVARKSHVNKVDQDVEDFKKTSV